MKYYLAAGVAFTLMTTAATAQDALPQQNNDWFKAGQSAIQEKLARTPNTNRAKNIIIMVSDGNGVGTNYATRIFAGQKKGMLGEEYVLPQETFPYLALVKTYNPNAQTPDSAGTATAAHSGVKTKAGVIGVDETLARGDCAAVEGAKVASIAEILSGEGKSVGVVSTARITHATPASVYAHSADRNFEDNSGLPEGCSQPDIAAQLIEQMKAGVIDVALGGGRRHFIPKEVKDEEGKGGKRTDGRNLIQEAQAMGAQFAWDDKTAAALSLGNNTPILGLFESSHMKYEHDRTGEPSLAEMTEAAIKALQGNENGFFLQVEAGRVDHANHDGNLHRVLTDGVAFADAVRKAAEMTSPEDTLIIVTADHGHTMTMSGYPARGNPILGLVHSYDENGGRAENPYPAGDGKPYTTLNYNTGPGSVFAGKKEGDIVERPFVTDEEAMDLDYHQQALVPSGSETHGGQDVTIYASGPGAWLFTGVVEQNYIFHVIMNALRLDPQAEE